MSVTICAVSDLLFATRITGTARALGIQTRVIATRDQLIELLDGDVARVIIDLNLDSDDPLDLIRTVKQHSDPRPVLGFVSHVQVELAEAARHAGADHVLPRSRFTADLPHILGGQYDPGGSP